MNGSRDKSGRKGGFVLVSILLVMTLLIAGATGYAWFARNQLEFISREKFDVKARGISYAAVLQIAKGLQYDDNAYDSFLEPWFGTQLIPVPELGILKIDIIPMDGKIPINELFLPDGETLRREMTYSWDEIWDIYEDSRLGTVLLDFLDRNTRPRLGGEERDYFPNRDLADISEIRLLESIPEEIFASTPLTPALGDLITVSGSGKINLNIASFAVLRLIDGVNETAALEIIEERQKEPFKSIEEVQRRVPSLDEGAIPRIMNLLGFKSSYFRINVEVRSVPDQDFKYYSAVLHKDGARCTIAKWEEN